MNHKKELLRSLWLVSFQNQMQHSQDDPKLSKCQGPNFLRTDTITIPRGKSAAESISPKPKTLKPKL